MTTIGYKALAERIAAMARSYEDRSRLARTTQEDGVSERHAKCAADLRTVVSLLNGMANAEPVARIYTDAELVHRDPRWGRVCWIVPECELDGGELLYLHPVPQPQAERQPVSEPTDAHPMLCATHYCKDCAALWRQCDDFSFTLRSQACCTACNNAPVGGQLFALTTPVAMPRPSDPTEAQIEQERSERVIVRRAIAERLRALPKFEERGR